MRSVPSATVASITWRKGISSRIAPRTISSSVSSRTFAAASTPSTSIRHDDSAPIFQFRYSTAAADAAGVTKQGAFMPRLPWFAIPLLAVISISATEKPSAIPAAVQRGMKEFSAEALKAHDRFLASDLLEGRAPGTRGDDLAMLYIAAQFESYGLQPAGDSGTYFQRVPLLGISMDAANTKLSFTKDGGPTIGPLKHQDEFVGSDQSQSTSSTINSDLVFLGHGVTAPEYRWDDYKGLDARGKTLVMLVDDPPASTSEPDLFKGKARTYYGRWT